MRVRLFAVVCAWLLALPVQAQDWAPTSERSGRHPRYAAKAQDSNVSFIQTKEGVVMIDTGRPGGSLAVMAILRNFPPARCASSSIPSRTTIIRTGIRVFASRGRRRARRAPRSRCAKQTHRAKSSSAGEFPGMSEAMKGYRQVLPHIEFQQKMTLKSRRAHAGAHLPEERAQRGDTAVWLQKNGCSGRRRPWGSSVIPISSVSHHSDILGLHQIDARAQPGGRDRGPRAPGTTTIFDEMERLLRAAARTRGQNGPRRQDARSDQGADQDAGVRRRGPQGSLPQHVEAAWRAVKGS